MPEKSPIPDLLDVISEWLKTSQYASEWEVKDSRKIMAEIKKNNPNLGGPEHLGTLSGWGWIFSIWTDRVDSFFSQQDWLNGNELMAYDPFFFERLGTSLQAVKTFRQNKIHISEIFPTV